MVTYKEITEHVIIVKENKGLFCSYFSDNFVDSMVFFKVFNAINLIIFLENETKISQLRIEVHFVFFKL